MKKAVYIIGSIIIIVLIFVIFMPEKELDINSAKIKDLYTYLGDVDINKCGGLTTYRDVAVSVSDIDTENKACEAYYHTLKKSEKTSEVTGKDENGTNTCKISDNITLSSNDELCNYEVINMNDLKETYYKLYNEDLNTEEDMFYIATSKACYKEGEEYYCGNALSYKISIAPDAIIYRFINKAIEKNDNIEIYDKFLKISDNKCFSKNNNIENTECSNHLSEYDLTNDEQVIELVKKYGSTYKHTFKSNSDSYYWSKSEPN